MYVANKIFLTRGVGQHKEKLVSFEMALRDAKLAPFNLVRVSSILPPYSRIVSVKEGIRELAPGQIIHTILAEASSNEHQRLISASVGVAVPKDRSGIGYLSEHHSFGADAKTTGDYAEDLAALMLATVLGADFDVNESYNEQLDHWKLSGGIVETSNITQASTGKKNLWTTVIAAAVLVPPGRPVTNGKK